MSWLKAKDWATGVEYSSLFHSGLRAISGTPRARRARAHSSSSSLQEKSSSGGTFSMVPVSSRLLKRNTTRTRQACQPMSISTDPGPTSPPHTPKGARPRPSSMFVRPTKEMTDAWSSGGGFFEIGEFPKFPEEGHRHAGHLMPPIEIDTVRSLAGSRPFIVNLGEMDATAVPQIGGESCLLLSSDQDGCLHHPVPRRERPVSMQTMPLPSRRSSLHHRTRETRRERGDCAWMLEESSPELKAYELGDEELRLDDERLDVADWRQFHVDWLQTIR
ncbi:hypothetical protein J3R82DRAFT_11234 [Butyriboletus roseoflavus]|nr:hypothetical protein J3R82DRAFT_11234 [Butyriboletus roseoflavus]